MKAEIIVQELKPTGKARCRILYLDNEKVDITRELIISPECIDHILKAGYKTIKANIQQMTVISVLGIKVSTTEPILDEYDLVKEIIGDGTIGKGKLAIELQKQLKCSNKTARTKIKRLEDEKYIIPNSYYHYKVNQKMYIDDFEELIK